MSTRERLAEALREHKVAAFTGMEIACACDRKWRVASHYREHVAAELESIADERAAEAVRQAFLDAAGEAIGRGRRGPIVTADWLLDFGQDRAAALRAATSQREPT